MPGSSNLGEALQKIISDLTKGSGMTTVNYSVYGPSDITVQEPNIEYGGQIPRIKITGAKPSIKPGRRKISEKTRELRPRKSQVGVVKRRTRLSTANTPLASVEKKMNDLINGFWLYDEKTLRSNRVAFQSLTDLLQQYADREHSNDDAEVSIFSKVHCI